MMLCVLPQIILLAISMHAVMVKFYRILILYFLFSIINLYVLFFIQYSANEFLKNKNKSTPLDVAAMYGKKGM